MARKFGPKTAAFLIEYERLGGIAAAARAAGASVELHYRELKCNPAYRTAFKAIAARAEIKIAKKKAKKVSLNEQKLRAEVAILRRQLMAAGIRWKESGKGDLLRKFVALKSQMAEFRKNLLRDVRELKAGIPKPRTVAARTRQAKRPADPDPATAILDQIAQGMANKPFHKLSATHQDAVRSIAERMKTTPD